MRKIKYIVIICLLLLIGISVKALDASEKIYDYANVLTPEQKESLKDEINIYKETYNIDMALVTVKYHNYLSTEKYADAIHDELIKNGFGIGEYDDSILCVLDFNTNLHKNIGLQISTNGNAIIMYDNTRINRILDSMENVFNNDKTNYIGIFKAFIDKSSYYAGLGIPKSNKNVKINEYGKPYMEMPFPWAQITIFSIIISTTIVIVLILRNKMVHKATNADLYLNKESISITNRKDQFLTTSTTRVRITSSSSGGGRAGGSSFHSSGGGFHGGGGRSL